MEHTSPLDPYVSVCDAIAALLRPYGHVILTDVETQTVRHVAGPAWRIHPGDPTSSGLDLGITSRSQKTIAGPFRTVLPDGHTLKSVEVTLKDQRQVTIGEMRISLDITAFEHARQALAKLQLNVFSTDINIGNQKPANWRASIDDCVATAMAATGASIDNLTPEQLADLIKELDMQGHFAIRNAMPYICKILNRSRATIYNHLRQQRNKNSILT
jgi:D-arginine utilization repressor